MPLSAGSAIFSGWISAGFPPAERSGRSSAAAIGRLRAGITIENPLLEEFQEKYSRYIRPVKPGPTCCGICFRFSEVSPGEVGFITIYFVMAMERKEKQERRISVMLVCPAGIGSSRLLASNLKKEYPDLFIRGTMSAFEIDCEKLKRDGVDLVISTIKLNIPYRYLQVNPLLTRQDKMLLNSRLTLLQQKKVQAGPESAAPRGSSIQKRSGVYLFPGHRNLPFSGTCPYRPGSGPWHAKGSYPPCRFTICRK